MNRLLILCLFGLVAIGCATPRGATWAEQRQYVQDMRASSLQELARANPAASERLKRAEGYAVFSNLKVQILTFGAGHGYGVAHDNQNGGDVYMRMAEVGVGIGMGVKDMRVIFVFFDRDAFSLFVEEGWQFGVEGEAAAVSGDKGGSLGGTGTVAGGAPGAGATGRVGGSSTSETVGNSPIEVYQFTENGLALRANVAGTKYWKDFDLN